MKAIPNTNNNYWVTEDGKVYSTCGKNKRNNPYLLRQSRDKDGYPQVSLSINGKMKTKLVHHLVAECYIGLRPKGKVIDHVDRVIANNHFSNLRYVPVSENNRNTPARKNNATGHKFILFNKTAMKYQVTANINGKAKYFGLFDKIEDAIVKRDQIVIQYNLYL